jgi:ribosomal protein S14
MIYNIGKVKITVAYHRFFGMARIPFREVIL